MTSFTISDRSSLTKAVDCMHDCAFGKKDVVFNEKDAVFTMKVKEYEWKGRFVKKRTETLVGELTLKLFNVRSCHISEENEAGYLACGEDHFNTIKFKDITRLIIKSTFHKITLHIEKLEGIFESRKIEES